MCAVLSWKLDVFFQSVKAVVVDVIDLYGPCHEKTCLLRLVLHV